MGYLHLLVPYTAKKHYQSYKALQSHTTLEVSDEPESLTISTDSGQIKILLGELVKWRENKELLMIYPSPYVYHIIPKRVGVQAEHLRELLNNTLGKAS